MACKTLTLFSYANKQQVGGLILYTQIDRAIWCLSLWHYYYTCNQITIGSFYYSEAPEFCISHSNQVRGNEATGSHIRYVVGVHEEENINDVILLHRKNVQ